MVGSLRDRVQLQRRQMERAPEGGHETLFVSLSTAWARVRVRSARLHRDGDGRAAHATHGVMLRYRADLKPGDRIVHRGRVLEILSADDHDGRRAWLSCLCIETSVTG